MNNESTRLKELQDLQILDTKREQAFDMITELASTLLSLPISAISLVDRDRQWFKSTVGLDVSETPRDISFCTHAIENNGLFIVNDASQDEIFRNNPLVTGAPNIKFYAGMPVNGPSGQKIGTLCVIGTKPNELNDQQKRTLEILGKQVEVLLLHKKSLQDLNHMRLQRKKLILQIIHDLKNPLTVASVCFDAVDIKSQDDDFIQTSVARGQKACRRMSELINDVLITSEKETDFTSVNLESFDLNQACLSIIDQFHEVVPDRQISLKNQIQKEVYSDRKLINRVIENLLSNAIKYAPETEPIFIDISQDQNFITIQIIDRGPGIPKELKEKIFKENVTASTTSNLPHKSHGIGLSFCKTAAKLLEGEVGIEDNSPKGSIFTFKIPAK